ncbi:LLM class flavin-dependent oxidoreductase [Blastococcus sp. HT6-30]|uniref:LLM class flavin-dependent oxidoreductase n=1 Tax=Blastococcus sp. HT6-30 TaxID=3144843 RepID=UPI003219689D
MTPLFAGTVQTHFGGYAPDRSDRHEVTAALRHCLREATVLDEANFDGILVAERHGRSECVAPDPLGLLAAIAAVTSRAFLGTYVHLPLLHHPIGTAEQFAQLDALSGGRAVAGLGAGFHPDYFDLFGAPAERRLTRLVEVVGILRAAWAGQVIDTEWAGRSLRGEVHPRPVEGQIPIWIGAQFPKAIAAAGRIGDGWAVAFPFDQPTWDAHWASYTREAEAAGRRPVSVLSRHCWVADSRETAEQRYAPLWLTEQRYYWDRGQLHHRDFTSAADFTIANAGPNLVLGTPEQCAEQLVDLVRNWRVDVVKIASRVPLGPEPAEVLENWQRIGTEVLPLVRHELTGTSTPPPRPRDLLL